MDSHTQKVRPLLKAHNKKRSMAPCTKCEEKLVQLSVRWEKLVQPSMIEEKLVQSSMSEGKAGTAMCE